MVTMKRVVILGGYGSFGSLIAGALADEENFELIVAGRNPVKGQSFADSIRAGFVQCDISKKDSLNQTISDAFLVINATGPFKASDYTVPEICIGAGCHYIDLGDGRDYVAGFSRLHGQAHERGVFVCTGASTSPAVTSAAVANLKNNYQNIQSIQIALSAGNKNPAGVSTIASILSYVGSPVRIWQDNRWQVAVGWSRGEFVEFPNPVGKRRVQLCNVPDLELFPKLFEVEDVIFKAGVELTLFNYVISILGLAKRLIPSLNLSALAKSLVFMSDFFKPFGSFNGGCAIWVTSDDKRRKSLALIAPENGPQIPIAPAILLSRKLLAGEINHVGAFPCIGFIDFDEYIDYLAPYGITVVYGKNGSWLI